MQMKKSHEETAELIRQNERTQKFGLQLSKQEALALVECRNRTLKKYHRVEFGRGILDKLIETFCDSQYINQDSYVEMLMELQDIFYRFKNESQDQLSDDELLIFMREQFEEICRGDLDYLSGTCLPRFAAAVRAGYRGYTRTEGRGEYETVTEEERWDRELYLEALHELLE